MTELRIEQLRVRIGGALLLDVTGFDVAGGELTVLQGGAASGKSLLASALAGTVPAGGRVMLNGRPLAGPPSRRRAAGLAAAVRDGERISGCSVAEAVGIAARDRGRITAIWERLPQLARRRGLDAGLLSGGEQQLLQVAAAWVAAPSALILDSPTVGLAADAAAAVAALAEERAGSGAVVLWLEQDPRAAPVAPVRRLVRGRLAPAVASSAGSV